MQPSGAVDLDSFDDRTHPRFWGQFPVAPWKRRFRCLACRQVLTMAETEKRTYNLPRSMSARRGHRHSDGDVYLAVELDNPEEYDGQS